MVLTTMASTVSVIHTLTIGLSIVGSILCCILCLGIWLTWYIHSLNVQYTKVHAYTYAKGILKKRNGIQSPDLASLPYSCSDCLV